MRCATHPEIETSLRCSKCGKPICVKCMVQTPVGARCAECARLYRLPTYEVSGAYYLRAAGVGLGLALACGIAWAIINEFSPLFFLNLLLAPLVGYISGELVSLAVNRKRGKGLAAIAGGAVAISYLLSIFVFGRLPMDIFSISLHIVALVMGILIAVNRLR